MIRSNLSTFKDMGMNPINECAAAHQIQLTSLGAKPLLADGYDTCVCTQLLIAVIIVHDIVNSSIITHYYSKRKIYICIMLFVYITWIDYLIAADDMVME